MAQLNLYVLKTSGGAIKGVGITPFVLDVGAGETQELVEVFQQTEDQGGIQVVIETPAEALVRAMTEYEGRFVLNTDKTEIVADDTDEATVTITTNLQVSDIDVDVNGVVKNVSISGGSGTLPGIKQATPGIIEIKPSDTSTYMGCGKGLLIIRAKRTAFDDETEIVDAGGKLTLDNEPDSLRDKFDEAKQAYLAVRDYIEDEVTWLGLNGADTKQRTREAILVCFDSLKWMWKAGDWD